MCYVRMMTGGQGADTEFLEQFADAEPWLFTAVNPRWSPGGGEVGYAVELKSFDDEKLRSCREAAAEQVEKYGVGVDDCWRVSGLKGDPCNGFRRHCLFKKP
jgi:hypothetical protein